MNRAQRRASGHRCHDCASRNVIVQADYGWLCDPCWAKRNNGIHDAVQAGLIAARPVNRDEGVIPCRATPESTGRPCGADATQIVEFARDGEICGYPACEQHIQVAVAAIISERQGATTNPRGEVKSMNDIDTRALAMSDDERESYLEEHGWQFAGAGWFAPGGTREEFPGGAVILVASAGGSFSKSSAIREQFAREAGLEPDMLGRCYRGTEPDDAFGRRW